MASVFHYVPEIEEKNKKIKAVTFIGDNLVVGDSQGFLTLYYDILQKTTSKGSSSHKGEVKISSKGIRKLEALPTIKTLLVLTEDLLLTMVNIPDFKLKEKIADGVENFAVHPFDDEVYVAKKNSNLLLYKREEDQIKLTLVKGSEKQLLKPVQIMEWGGSHGEFLYIGHQKEYVLLDLKDGMPTSLNIAPPRLPFLKLSPSEIAPSHNPLASIPVKWYAHVKENFLMELIQTSPQGGLFELPKDGVLVGVEQRGIYLVCVMHDQILVFNKQKDKQQTPIQTIKVQEGYEYKCIVDSSKNSLFVLMTTDSSKRMLKSSETHSQIMRLDETPYTHQMQGMLIKGQVEDARTMLSRYLKISDRDRARKFYEFNLDAGWALFKSLQFEECVIYFSESNFDFRELLLFFEDLIPRTKAPNFQSQIFYKTEGVGQMEPDFPKLKNLIVNYVQQSSGKSKISTEAKNNDAFRALYDILIAKRESLIFQYSDIIQERHEGEPYEEVKLTFPTSTQSVTRDLMKKASATTLDDYLVLIDETIIKLLVASAQFSLNQLTRFFKKYGGLGEKREQRLQSRFQQESKFPFQNPTANTSPEKNYKSLYLNQKRLLYYLKDMEQRSPDTVLGVKSGVAQALVLECAKEDAEAIALWQKLGLNARKDLDGIGKAAQSDKLVSPSKEFHLIGDSLHNTKRINQEVLHLGVHKTIKLLQQAGNRDLLLKHCKWILEVSPRDSIPVFDNPRETYNLTYDDILRKLEQVGSASEDKLNLKIQYLERLVYQQNYSKLRTPSTRDIRGLPSIIEEEMTGEGEAIEERFYTLLAICYADRLYKYKGKEMPRTTNKQLLAANKEMIELQEKFRNFLVSFDKYQASMVLDKIKGTAWMVEEEIILLGREHKHRQVLEKYISAGEIMKAEVHCERHLDEPNLMNDFFELLIANYETQNELLKKSKEQRSTYDIGQQKNKVNNCKHDILEYLDKHSNNPFIDFGFILNKLPDEWQLQHDDDNSGTEGIASSYVSYTLLPFLKNAFKCKIQQSQELKVKKGLTKMELINAQKEKVLRQRPSYHLSESTKCCVCKKKVGLKLFSIYPNGNIVHTQRCMKDPFICPETGTNFKYNF